MYGVQLIAWLDARIKMPLATPVVPIQEHETLSLRAPVTQSRPHLVGHAHLQKVVFDKGCMEGVDLRWLDQHGSLCVVPARAKMAVTIERRGHTVRQGKGRTA